ncbi:MAG: O-methyltransferase [Ferruginibacter sp.]|nr:O-methyltransferase [Chitinophagaceae bacterium]
MELINPQVQLYAEHFSSDEGELLKEINAWTLQHHPEYQMLSGHLQGKVLEMISCMISPRRILEIGTFTGYSGICLAKGLTADGELHTLELREADASVAKGFFDRSSFASKIILHTGNALNIIPTLQEEWDLVFIDADKPGYIEYFNLVLPKVRKNGYILADNVFLHGEALENEPKGKAALGIKAFNEHIRSRKDIENVILTLRDGLCLIRKL